LVKGRECTPLEALIWQRRERERERASTLGKREGDSRTGRKRVSTPRRERGRFGKASTLGKKKGGFGKGEKESFNIKNKK
jgi:hypothetical protein